MSREIKFRARDTDGTWIYSKPMPDMGFWKWVQYDSTTIFSEFTGLKDKNGVEIYEGDIIRISSRSRTAAFTVEYFDRIGMFGFTDGGREYHLRSRHETADSSWHVEVVGNIYEDPELLESN